MADITLPEKCDRPAAEALLPELANAMGDDPINIDGSGVKQIGQSVLQVLLAARRSAGGAAITGSDALREAARLTGLETELFDGASS